MSNDDTQPVSGSRWEQPEQPDAQPAAQPAPQNVAPNVAQYVAPTAPQPVPGPAYAPAPQPRKHGRLLLAGGAVGIALVAGAGGFALGQATADDDHEGQGRFGFMQNGGPDGGPQGTFPGQPPGGFPDQGDDDDGRGLPDDEQSPDGGSQDAPNT